MHTVGPEPTTDLSSLTALVVDEHGMSREAYVRFLQQLGVGHVLQASTPETARPLLLRSRASIGVVICEAVFTKGGAGIGGLDFISDLRSSNQLHPSAACLLVTAEARYQHVVDALDERVDDYLLKPVTQGVFERRLMGVLQRKAHLRPVYQAIQSRAIDDAAQACLELTQQRGEHWQAAAKLGTDLLLGCGRTGQAKRLLQLVEPHSPPLWARLGLAQALLESGEAKRSADTLEAVIRDVPDSAKAHDMLCRAYLEEQRLTDAVASLEQAVALTPGSVSRRQRLGALLQAKGAHRQAHTHLGMALAMGRQTRAFNYLGLVHLALSALELDEPREWERAKVLLHQQGTRSGPSRRLQTLEAMLTLIQALEEEDARLAKRTAQAVVDGVTQGANEAQTACTAMLLLAKASALLEADSCTAWARQVARRYGDSKGNIGLLSQACLGNKHLVRGVGEASEEIQTMAQAALVSSLHGEHERTVASLFAHYGETGNLRFLHLAKASLDKHANSMSEADRSRWRREVERASASSTGYVLRSDDALVPEKMAERRADPNLFADVDELLG